MNRVADDCYAIGPETSDKLDDGEDDVQEKCEAQAAVILPVPVVMMIVVVH